MILRITLTRDDLEALKEGRVIMRNIRGQIVEIEADTRPVVVWLEAEEANKPEGKKT